MDLHNFPMDQQTCFLKFSSCKSNVSPIVDWLRNCLYLLPRRGLYVSRKVDLDSICRTPYAFPQCSNIFFHSSTQWSLSNVLLHNLFL